MNSRTELLTSVYKPVVAIMVYKYDHNYYLESHDVNDKGEILSGKPLLQETIQGMVDVFFDERKNRQAITGIIPENLLSFSPLPGGRYRMAWFRPEEQRVIHHSTALNIATGIASVPALLYVADSDDLSVYALKSSKRPDENSKIYRAPFFNVADGGDVCLGSANVKKPESLTYASLIKYWEDLFWLSEFTHVNGGQKIKSPDLKSLWRQLIKDSGRKFPKEELIPMKEKLNDLIK